MEAIDITLANFPSAMPLVGPFTQRGGQVSISFGGAGRGVGSNLPLLGLQGVVPPTPAQIRASAIAAAQRVRSAFTQDTPLFPTLRGVLRPSEFQETTRMAELNDFLQGFGSGVIIDDFGGGDGGFFDFGSLEGVVETIGRGVDLATRVVDLLNPGGGVPSEAVPSTTTLGFPRADPGVGLMAEAADLVPSQRSALACFPFLATNVSPVRAKSVVEVMHPATGKTIWYRNMGRPMLWSGDLAATKRVRRAASKARSKSR